MNGSGDTWGGQLCGGLGGGIDFKTATRAWPSTSPGGDALSSHMRLSKVASPRALATSRRYCATYIIVIVLFFIVIYIIYTHGPTSHQITSPTVAC